jgi:hypothetical protein
MTKMSDLALSMLAQPKTKLCYPIFSVLFFEPLGFFTGWARYRTKPVFPDWGGFERHRALLVKMGTLLLATFQKV